MLSNAIARLPNLEDEITFLLRKDDHPTGESSDVEFVADRSLDDATGVEEICDLSKSLKEIDLRDEVLRSSRSGFAELCAECVRQATAAHIAILNAGCFRADAKISPVVRLCDLKDIFLYDKKDAVVVLELPLTAVDHLLTYARQQIQRGAFPQVSSSEIPSVAVVRLAIVSYLIFDSNSIDGYRQALAEALRIDEKTAFEIYLESSTRGHCSIIDAVRAHARDLPCESFPVAASRGLEGEFIGLVDVFLDFLGLRGSSDRAFPTEQFEDALSREFDDPKITTARNALFEFIRNLPEVREFERCLGKEVLEASDIQRETVVALARSQKRLRRFGEALSEAPENFSKRIPYDVLFRDAAEGIGGWIN
jgi:hypothetical protein